MKVNKQIEQCTLCGQPSTVDYLGSLNQQVLFRCPNCGVYSVTDLFKERRFDAKTSVPFHLLSGYVREMNELDQRLPIITSSNWEDLINNPLVPKAVYDKFIKLMRYIRQKSTYYKEPVSLFDGKQPAICYAKNQMEFMSIAEDLLDNGYLQSNRLLTGTEYWLTLKGEQHLSELDKLKPVSEAVFVAMWFSDEMVSVYQNAIKPAIESSECGTFLAFRVDNREFNEDITDAIIAGIKQSRFTVADLTGCRGGVYYEAGFARGLGQQVILTCRKDWQYAEKIMESDGRTIVTQEGVHFDVNHLNIIFWSNVEELKGRLIERIRATIK